MERVGIFERVQFNKVVDDNGVSFTIGDPAGNWKADLSLDDLEELFTAFSEEFPDFPQSKTVHFIRSAGVMLTKIENILGLTLDEIERLTKENHKK